MVIGKGSEHSHLSETDVRDLAAKKGVTVDEAVKDGLQEKAEEFAEWAGD